LFDYNKDLHLKYRANPKQKHVISLFQHGSAVIGTRQQYRKFWYRWWWDFRAPKRRQQTKEEKGRQDK